MFQYPELPNPQQHNQSDIIVHRWWTQPSSHARLCQFVHHVRLIKNIFGPIPNTSSRSPQPTTGKSRHYKGSFSCSVEAPISDMPRPRGGSTATGTQRSLAATGPWNACQPPSLLPSLPALSISKFALSDQMLNLIFSTLQLFSSLSRSLKSQTDSQRFNNTH